MSLWFLGLAQRNRIFSPPMRSFAPCPIPSLRTSLKPSLVALEERDERRRELWKPVRAGNGDAEMGTESRERAREIGIGRGKKVNCQMKTSRLGLEVLSSP